MLARSLVLLVSLCFSCQACTGAGQQAHSDRIEGPNAARAIVGRVAFEARQPTKQGASDHREILPARFVMIEVLDSAGQAIASGATDERGQFELSPPPGAAQVAVWARIDNGEHDIAVTLDINGSQTHRLTVPITGDGPLDIVATDGGAEGLAGAFHILDTILTGLDATERWTGRQMPPVFVYWGRGVTTSWSYYRGQQPSGSGRYALELLAGQPGRQHTTDTDEHDEAIMLHELGHMVMDLVSTSSSVGGRHPPGYYIDPGLAWEEGRVSWFAVAIRGDPLYQDTIGVEPLGSLRVDRDYSRVNQGPRGNGSEQTVGEVLWDLADGAGGIADADDDGVALGPEGLMAAMVALNEVEGAYPCLSTFLRFLVTSGRVTEHDVKNLLSRTGQPEEIYPSEGAPSWPEDLTIPAVVSGEIDGLTSPAPSGGPTLATTGYDAVHAYRVHLEGTGGLEVRLEIAGSGSPDDRQDLELELRDRRGDPIGQSRGVGNVEMVRAPSLPSGWYIIYVRDSGQGNRARYQLSVR